MHINTMALLATLLEEFRFKIQNSTDVVKRNAYFLEAPGKIKVVSELLHVNVIDVMGIAVLAT